VLSWLSDNSLFLCILFLAVGWGFLVFWWRTKQRHYLLGVYVSAPLALAFAVLPYLNLSHSDARQIEQVIRDMCKGVKANDVDRVFRHLSKDFRHGGKNKEDFCRAAEKAIVDHNVEDVIVWDFEVLDLSREKRIGQVAFSVKAKGNWSAGAEYYRCEAEFLLNTDNRWRLRGFELFNPYANTRAPIPIPF
jgi:hypothetical protein